MRLWLLLLEKGLKCLSRFLHFVSPSHRFRRASESKVLAQVGSFLVYDALSGNLPTLIVRFGVIRPALFAAAKIPFAVRACVASGDLAADVQSATAKGTVHRLSLLIRVLVCYRSAMSEEVECRRPVRRSLQSPQQEMDVSASQEPWLRPQACIGISHQSSVRCSGRKHEPHRCCR